jgi:hypothetical protein
VIEHVRYPATDLAMVAKILKSNGVLAINTPNSGSLVARLLGRRWHLLVPPEHLHYFNPEALTLLLRATGFEVLAISYPGKIFTLEYIIHTLARWQGFTFWKMILAFLKKHPGLGQLGLAINLHDNMLIYAKKSDYAKMAA